MARALEESEDDLYRCELTYEGMTTNAEMEVLLIVIDQEYTNTVFHSMS